MRWLDRPHDWSDAANIVISQDFLPQIGGAHTWLYESYKRWSSPVQVLTKRYSEVAQIADSERDFDRQDHDSLEILRQIPPPGELSLIRRACLKSYIRQLRCVQRLAGAKPVILHCLRAFPEGFAGALYKLLHPHSAMLVVYAHGEEVLIAKTSRQLEWMAKRAYSTADLIIVNSESTRNLVTQLCPNARVVCVHPGVNASNFLIPPADVANYRESWGWPPDTVVLSTLARMEPRKNHGMGIRVLQKLRSEGLPLAFVCAGEGEERARLTKMVTDLGLQEWSRFPGAIPEREKGFLLAASDIFAMPSIQVGEMIEGFGMVFLEASAAGVPVVCGNTGGQPEAVLDMETGIVVNGEDLDEVAAAVRNLTVNADLRSTMGARGRQWAAEHSWDQVVERTRRAIQEALNGLHRGVAMSDPGR